MRLMTNEALIGVQDAAKLANASIDAIKRAARSGALPVALKMPGATGAYLFRVADVEAYATERANKQAMAS